MGKFLIFCVAIGLSLQSYAAQAQTDPVARAKTLRYAGQLDQAESVLAGVLKTNPNHYLANYNMGLVYEARAQRVAPGIAKNAALATSAQWMEKALAIRVKTNEPEFTIYNTLGYVYLQQNNLIGADRVLNQGLPYANRLTPASRAKLYNNLGYLQARKGDRAGSIRYFNMASSVGATPSQTVATTNARNLKSVK